MKRFAVFDVDGTIFKSSCLEKVVDTGIEHGIFSSDAFQKAHIKRERWQQNNNEGVYQSYLSELVGAFVNNIVGVSVEQFQGVVEEMVSRHRVRRFAFTRMLVEQLRDSHTLVAISGSPEIVVKPFLEDMGFDHVVGSTFGTEKGLFTADVKAVKKPEAFQQIAGNVQPDVVTGDTVGDIAILSQASRPIAFNPSAALRKRAAENQWPIVIENKDAITQLLPTDNGYKPVFDRNPMHVLGAIYEKI